MTRINIGINPQLLTRQHLLSEAREIKRIPNMVKKGRAVVKDIPTNFSLGKGHVKFFYNKLGFLLKRYVAIHAECLQRGYNVQDFSSAWAGVPSELMCDYNPSWNDIAIIQQRLMEKDVDYKNVFKIK